MKTLSKEMLYDIDNEFFTYLKLIFLDNDEVVIKKLKSLIKDLIQMNFDFLL